MTYKPLHDRLVNYYTQELGHNLEVVKDSTVKDLIWGMSDDEYSAFMKSEFSV